MFSFQDSSPDGFDLMETQMVPFDATSPKMPPTSSLFAGNFKSAQETTMDFSDYHQFAICQVPEACATSATASSSVAPPSTRKAPSTRKTSVRSSAGKSENQQKKKLHVWVCWGQRRRGNRRKMRKPPRKARDPGHPVRRKKQLPELHLSAFQKSNAKKRKKPKTMSNPKTSQWQKHRWSNCFTGQNKWPKFFHWLLWCSKETSPCATLDGVFWGWHTRVRIESSSISGARTSFHASHEPMWLEPHSSDMLYQQQWQGYALV